MPNRIIKESICFSESIRKLSWFEEVFFYRLIVNCDDYGRLDARPEILQARLFPLRRDITESTVLKTLNVLTAAGMVQVYTYDSKPFLQLTAWEQHQQIRATKSKYPAPDDTSCNQMISDDIKCPRNPIRIRESYSDICTEQDAPAPKGTLPLNDGTDYPIYADQIEKWESLYPSVDVKQELRTMLGWLESHPQKRKTKRGINAFINGWLAREQDKGKRG